MALAVCDFCGSHTRFDALVGRNPVRHSRQLITIQCTNAADGVLHDGSPIPRGVVIGPVLPPNSEQNENIRTEVEMVDFYERRTK